MNEGCDMAPGNTVGLALGGTGMMPPAPRNSNWHEVKIFKVANGFVLAIGCKQFVAKSWEEVNIGLSKYWKDPIAAEKEYTQA